MKKTFIILTIIAILILSLTLFVACEDQTREPYRPFKGNIDVSVELGGGTFMPDYYNRFGVTEPHRYVFNIDKNDYIVVKNTLPTADDLIAPSGKAFAGWYFVEECYDDDNFSENNWRKYVSYCADGVLEIYAKWVDRDFVAEETLTIVFDTNRADALFASYGVGEPQQTKTNTYSLKYVYNDFAVSMPMINSFAQMPGNMSIDYWYFENGEPYSSAGVLSRIGIGMHTINLYAHWVQETRVYFNCVETRSQPASNVTIRFSDEVLQRQIYYRDKKNQQAYVLREDFDALMAMLPKKNEAIVTTRKPNEQGELEWVEVQESFERFGWRLSTRDENGNTVYVDLTRENWLDYVDSQKIKTVTLVLDYALKDTNKIVFVSLSTISSQGGGNYVFKTYFDNANEINTTEYRFELSFPEDVIADYDTYGDKKGFYIERDNFAGIADMLPSFDSLVLTKVYADGTREDATELIDTLSWEFYDNNSIWFIWNVYRAEYNEANWLFATERNNLLGVAVRYSIKNPNA